MKQLILLLIPFFCLYPQITGTVIDAETSKPLQGVNITSGEIGTASNNEGRFKLNVQPEVEVTFSHIGYAIISVPTFDGMIIKLKESLTRRVCLNFKVQILVDPQQNFKNQFYKICVLSGN